MENVKFTLWAIFVSLTISTFTLKADSTESSVSGEWEGLVPGNAVWIWDATKMLVANPEEQRRFLAFCANPHGEARPIKTLFLYAGWKNYLKENSSKLREFLRTVHEHDIKVHYLDGTPKWADKHRHLALRKISRLRNFNRGGNRSEQFDGIHFDVEPYLLKNWRDPRIVQAYREHLVECVQAAHKTNLPLGLALPNFYDSRDDDLLEFTIKTVDYIALMNYKDNAVMMIANARQEVETATKLGKPIWLGVETQAPTTRYGVTPRETFFEEGYVKMEEELKLLKAEYPTSASILGIAYHHLESYRSLDAEETIADVPKQPVVSCEKINGPIRIDGSLEEWTGRSRLSINEKQNVVYSVEENAWNGINDLSGTVHLAWDDRALYVCGKVTDDIIVQESSGTELWRGDHVEIWIDTQPSLDPVQRGYNEYTYQFGISPGNFDKQAPEFCVWLPADLDNSIKEIAWATKQNKTGYSFETRIPWSLINVESGNADFLLRVNVDLSDTDNPEKEQKLLMSTSTTRIFSDPTTFLTVQLTD